MEAPKYQPSALEEEHAVLAQQEAHEAIARMLREGLEFHATVVGVSTALANVLNDTLGHAGMVKWFAETARLTANLPTGVDGGGSVH